MSFHLCSFAHTLAGPGYNLVGHEAQQGWEPTSWIGRLWWLILEVFEDIYRFARLLTLFAPLLLTAPFRTKLQGRSRQLWLRRLRSCSRILCMVYYCCPASSEYYVTC